MIGNQTRRCLWLGVLALITLLLGTVMTIAQESSFSEQEQEWINDLQIAFDNMAALTSVRITTMQTITQITTAEDNQIRASIEQTSDAAINFGDNPNGSIKSEQSTEMQTNEDSISRESTVELVLQDNVVYFRTDAAPLDEWSVDERDDAFSQFIRNLSPDIQYPIILDAITTIERIEADTLDGLSMQVFRLELSLNDMRDSVIYQQIEQLLPVLSNNPDLANQILTDAVVQMTIFVSEVDKMVFRQEVSVQIDTQIADTIPGTNFRTQFQIGLTRQTDYYSFNEPVEIEIIQTD